MHKVGLYMVTTAILQDFGEVVRHFDLAQSWVVWAETWRLYTLNLIFLLFSELRTCGIALLSLVLPFRRWYRLPVAGIILPYCRQLNLSLRQLGQGFECRYQL